MIKCKVKHTGGYKEISEDDAKFIWENEMPWMSFGQFVELMIKAGWVIKSW